MPCKFKRQTKVLSVTLPWIVKIVMLMDRSAWEYCFHPHSRAPTCLRDRAKDQKLPLLHQSSKDSMFATRFPEPLFDVYESEGTLVPVRDCKELSNVLGTATDGNVAAAVRLIIDIQ